MKLPNALQDIATINTLMTGAESEARRAGDSLPGAEHLLLSALALPDGTARRAFERVGADPDQFRGAISSTHAAALRGIGIGIAADGADLAPASVAAAPAKGVFRYSASAQEAFQAAVKLSKATKPSLLLGAHVVLGVCQLEHGTAVRGLSAMGVDRAELAAAAADVLAAGR